MNWRQASFQIKKTKQKEIHHQQPHHHHPLHLSRYRRHFKRPLQSNAFPFLFSLNIRKKIHLSNNFITLQKCKYLKSNRVVFAIT